MLESADAIGQRACPICGELLVRREYESRKNFEKRVTCGEERCARIYRSRQQRASAGRLFPIQEPSLAEVRTPPPEWPRVTDPDQQSLSTHAFAASVRARDAGRVGLPAATVVPTQIA